MTNPFFEDWATPYAVPPFAEIKDEHFKPAYLAALEEHRAEIAAIAGNAEAPTFQNTIEALELSGKRLDRIDLVFSQLTSANTNETLQAIELELAPQLARHWTSIYLDPTLFARVDALFAKRDSLGLSSEARRVLERYHLDFVRAGAKLSAADRARSGEIAERLSVLGTVFGQNVLADEQNTVFGLEEAEVAGLPESTLSAAAETARDRQLNAPYAVTTSRSSVEPVLHLATNRAVREKIWRAFVKRGANGNAHDNHAVIAEILQLRAELASLLGYESYAHFKLDDTMAGSPRAARELLEQVWAPGRQRVIDDRADLQAIADAEGGDFAIAPWDWRYYADKLRMARYDFDENAIKPYLQLENVVEAAFFVAGKLFGVSFAPRDDIAGYHPDVRVWEVMRGGKTIGIFYGDFYARPGKRSGAWMTSFRKQSKLDGEVLPLIVNTCNFMKPSEGKPALLSLDEARTVFHEFGHGLHGLLSNVTYPRISGTSVVRDFVELPSQIYEHWLESKPVLERLVHYRTGEPIPEALLAKLKAASNANQGFATVEFVSSAILDMDLHSRTTIGANVDVAALEQETLQSIEMPAEIALRHASPHFLHLFSGDGYAAGYYSYLWSEVLDADGYEAFEEAGDPFDPATAEKLYTYIYSSGGSRDFSEAYRLFRGRDPDVKALLQGRGLGGAEQLQDSDGSSLVAMAAEMAGRR